MLGKLFKSLGNFLSSIFGGSKKTTPKTTTPPIPKPPVDEKDQNLEEPVQDAQEVPEETVIVTNVEDVEIIEPIEEVEDFEEDPFEEETPPDIPATELPPVLEEPTTPPTTTNPPPPPPPKHRQRYLWCLDNGHGKLQAGKRSKVFDDGVTQFLEYEFNRDVVKKIIKILDKKGVAYYDIVPDVNVQGSFLKGRVNRANNKKSELKKIFVSVHSNAGGVSPDGWGAAHGIETWHHANSRKGKKIAAIFQQKLIDELGWRNRQLKSTAIKSLYVLKETHMPAILTENGFFTNKTQAAELMRNSVRQKIADAHVAAIMEIEENGL